MRPLAVLGAVIAGFGFVILFQRGVAGFFDFGYGIVTLVGVLALVQGLRYGLARRGADRRSVDLGDPEARYEVPAPGADLDDRLRRTRGFSHSTSLRRERLRDRIREVAVEAVSNRQGVSRRTADGLVREGDWTDDPVAAAFFADDLSYPVSAYVRARLSGKTTFAFGIHRAIDEIEGMSE